MIVQLLLSACSSFRQLPLLLALWVGQNGGSLHRGKLLRDVQRSVPPARLRVHGLYGHTCMGLPWHLRHNL
eukprot:8412523-Pyramimonas_sp.AAC.1